MTRKTTARPGRIQPFRGGPVAAAAIVLAACLGSSAAALGADAKDLPRTAIVFTGQLNRVEKGLELLERGDIDRLFISGVNAPAGIRPDTFDRQFGLSEALRNARADGRLVLGPAAGNTLENGAETACWLRDQGITGPVLLISSNRHIARATAALENAAPEIGIVSLGVDDTPGPPSVKDKATEFAALTATRLLGFLPGHLSVGEEFLDCSGVEFL